MGSSYWSNPWRYINDCRSFVWTVFSYLIYGFGVLVENSQILVESVETHDKKTLLRKENGADDADRVKSNIQRNADNARRKKIEDLRKSGLITEEEYRNAISKIQ